MKKTRIAFAILLLTFFFGESCTHKKVDTCVAGTSGNFTLNVFLQHESHQVINLKGYRDTVYIKYNTLESPGITPSDYDTAFIGTYPADSVSIPNLSCGNYFLFEVGFESAHSKRITGGIAFTVSANDVASNVTIEGAE